MPPIDPTKVQQKLNELNAAGNPGAPNWIVSEGLKAVTSMSLEGEKITFNPNAGIPLKVFVNITSGEVKLFDARKFSVNK